MHALKISPPPSLDVADQRLMAGQLFPVAALAALALSLSIIVLPIGELHIAPAHRRACSPA